jgi:hypothetical protein
MIYVLKITLFTALFCIPGILLYFFLRLIGYSRGSVGQSVHYSQSFRGYEERMRHEERMRELKEQSAHLHERNLYERGHSIYSHKHTDF